MKQIRLLLAWAVSPRGQMVIHRAITTALTVYVVLHRTGV